MLYERLPEFVRDNFYCGEWKDTSMIRLFDFSSEWQDIADVLAAYWPKKSFITNWLFPDYHLNRRRVAYSNARSLLSATRKILENAN